MILENSDNIHPILSDLAFQPGSGLFSNAVMVTHSCAGCLNRTQNAILQGSVVIDARIADDKNEIEISALRISVRDMCHTNRGGVLFNP